MWVDDIRDKAGKAIAPLIPANEKTIAPKDFLLTAMRTEAGRRLPPYYFAYFLLVDLLNFRNIGRSEKIAWSVPVDFEGKAFLIEHRKFGVGVFAENLPDDEAAAAEIVHLIQNGVKAAQPYFDQLASDAVAGSNLNVVNKSSQLFDRYRYHSKLHREKHEEAERRKDERVVTTMGNMTSTTVPVFDLRREANWLALAAIECFFSWTEHVFIHMAILSGSCITGAAVATLARSDWPTKYKAALDLDDPISKQFYDELVSVRRQIRNFIAHGSFGKQGEAFSFHSSAGAVPVRFSDRTDDFRVGLGVDFEELEAISIIERFVDHLWSGPRAPARIFLESGLPLILPMAAQGDYRKAMASESEMIEFTDYLGGMADNAANMDW